MVLVLGTILSGCSKTASPAKTTGSEQPQYGGTLRVISLAGPHDLGYYPDMGPGDTWLGYSEQLLNFDRNGNLVPVLAESWDIDKAAPSLTWHLRKNVKFHDGTPFNADAVIWTFQLIKEAGRLQYADTIKSMEAIDDNTVRFNLTKYNTMMITTWGNDIPYVSPTAIKTNGKEWALTNAYGTGPFKIKEFKRDTYLKLEKNTDYWRSGRPYLDAVEFRYMSDQMTAAASLQAGEADLLFRAADINTGIDLEKKGYKVTWEGVTDGVDYFMLPDSANPGSILAKKEVREAIEYAIDRPALAQAITQGHGAPQFQLAPLNNAAYNSDYKGREYNPEKAKQLLKQAGYPDGFETTIYTCSMFAGAVDAATSVQASLAAVGIKAKLDVGDIAKFFTQRAQGWKDGLQLGLFGLDPSYDHVFLLHLGPLPTTNPLASLGRTPEYTALVSKASQLTDTQSEQALVKQLVKQVAEDAMVIPLFTSDSVWIMQNKVHFNYVGTNTWKIYDDWIEK
jgi:peptide/nickel transport system substrate-binding protein